MEARAGKHGDESRLDVERGDPRDAGDVQDIAAWMQRLQAYRNAKDGVLRQSSLTAEAKALMIDELERTQFTAEELREVQILESIRAQNGQAGRAAQSG